MIIQVYEIQSLEEAKKCVQLDIDHIGSVLLDLDHIPKELFEVVELVKAHGKLSSIIPLGSDVAKIIKAIKAISPNIVHLCEDLFSDVKNAKELQVELKEKIEGIQIMRTIPIPRGFLELRFFEEIIYSLEPFSDYFLLDTWLEQPPVKGFVGITGKTCNWDLARSVVDISKKPCILAGGLGPDNVYDAIKKVRPYGVDSCTKTNMEDADGNTVRFKKDFEKLARFIKEARRGFEES